MGITSRQGKPQPVRDGWLPIPPRESRQGGAAIARDFRRATYTVSSRTRSINASLLRARTRMRQLRVVGVKIKS